MNDTTTKNVHFVNQFNAGIPRSGVIGKQTISHQYLFYHCSQDGPEIYFENWILGILEMDHVFLQK